MDRVEKFGAAIIACLIGFTLGFITCWCFQVNSNAGNVSTLNQINDPIAAKVAELQKAYESMLSERAAEAKSKRGSGSQVRAAIKKEVIVFTLPNCPPCKAWIETQSERFAQAGWSVGVVEYPQHPYRQAPTFQICVGEKCYTSVGSLSLEYAEQLYFKGP